MTPDVAEQITPLTCRILEANPGVMTGPGTNTYLVGSNDGEIAVIDPGEDDAAHLDAVAAAGDGRIRWILVTHTHSDHSPGAAALRERTGAEVLGFDERDGFAPDRTIGDGFVLDGGSFRLRAIHTPGHASNHLCYLLEDERTLFSGDHIMSGSTVVIAPPDGDMAAYLQALAAVRELPVDRIAPGHGPIIDDPVAKVDEYVMHRATRERTIFEALAAAGRAGVDDLVAAVYTDVPEALHPIARYSVWAHLRKLASEGRARAADADDVDSRWEVVPPR